MVRAEDKEECFDLITTYSDDYPEFYGRLRENIDNAPKYALVDDNPSAVLESFLT